MVVGVWRVGRGLGSVLGLGRAQSFECASEKGGGSDDETHGLPAA